LHNTRMKSAPLDILSSEECDRIHGTTVDILRQVGVHVPHAEARSILADAGARVGPDDRVYIPEDVLLKAIESAPSVVTLTGLDPARRVVIGADHVNFMGGAGLLNILDLEGNYRPATLKDLADFTRLCDALEYLDVNHGMCDPSDAAGPGLYPLAASRIIPNTTKPTALVIDGGKDVEAIAEMASVALGSEAAVRERPFFTIHDSTALSPLRHDPKNAEVLLEACRRGFPTGLVAWPMMGLTSPVTVAGTMAQRNASALVGLILAQTVNPGNPFIIQMTCGGIDMRTGNVVTASPEIGLAGMVGAQMARRYGLPSVIIAGTDAKIPDAQAGAEKTFMLTSAALAGVNLIHGSTSEMDGMMVASAEQCVIDNDIMGMVRHLISGVQVNEETLALDVIQEVSLGDGNFMVHPHTLARFRDLYEPVAFTRRRMQDWASRGAMSARESAAHKARKILDEHFPSPLSGEQVAEIEKIAEAYSNER
jgi:trimethylamine--corrinoid protein Co-methyltransferase